MLSWLSTATTPGIRLRENGQWQYSPTHCQTENQSNQNTRGWNGSSQSEKKKIHSIILQKLVYLA